MQEGRTRRTASLAAAFAAVVICGPAGAGSLQGAREAADRTPARVLVAAASGRATAKLRNAECREVLSDFRDAGGRRLSDVLGERGLSPDAFLARLVFLDGRGTPLCDTGHAAVVANPGSIFIGVCKETFARVEAADPGLATIGVIHEMLHALGLGENPPTSEEITRQVAMRCGR